jgi:hypothetical protein
MKRRLFNLAAAVSLVLCAGMIVTCVRSFWVVDMILWGRCTLAYPQEDPQKVFSHVKEGRLGLGRGGFSFEVTTSDTRFPRSAPIQPWAQWSHWSSAGPTYAPFKYARVNGWLGHERITAGPDPNGAAFTQWSVWFPAVLPITLATVLPCLWLLRHFRLLRARRKGVCPSGGDDLRATPDRRPECGTAAQPPHNPPMQRTGGSVIL